ncbi:DUF5367 family protein [Flavobacterium sp. ANB]|uniref:DUF5367 family protein n=1 Tax=unclassified Flavobacterium TaxID=196869 RepID=UPI0012B8477F|nr:MULTISPECIES: DUF5367 family protein [unclassified Flavobacterium]MBF4515545.1 DUF5367 family protein [Flavobacterium sp. ANB]MTD68548.1 hypothetical protein [Flavobacterium sp. LC2016-13]
MNYVKILLPGILVWIAVSISFYILSFVPLVNSSFPLQAALVMLLIIFYANESAKIYYKSGSKIHGFVIGITMSIIVLLLDIIITVPFFEIPNGRSYHHFFSNPVLWILVSLNILTVYFYWRNQVRNNR